MQGPRELGGEPGQTPSLSWPPSDVAEEAGKVPRCQASEDSGASGAPGRQCGADSECVRARPHLPPSDGEASTSGLSEGFATCATGGPDAGEHSSAWGEFESFQESSAKSEQLLSQSFELRERAPQLPRTVSAQKGRSSQQPRQGGTAAVSPAEPIHSYESIFRFAFQEVPVQQVTDQVPALHHLLDISDEEEPGLGSAQKCCPESRKLWRALRSAHKMVTSRCLWPKSHCQENLLLVLGVDATQNHSGGQCPVSEGPMPREPAEVGVPSFWLHCCRALIQTTLVGTPGGRRGSLITCSLFLQNPLPSTGRWPLCLQQRSSVLRT